jgi:hypothetical protein
LTVFMFKIKQNVIMRMLLSLISIVKCEKYTYVYKIHFSSLAF